MPYDPTSPWNNQSGTPWHDPEPWHHHDTWRVDGHGRDQRLIVQAWVDGRLVESRTGSVEGTRWQHRAEEFDAASRPVIPPPPPRERPHVEVLGWLDRLVGGRDALVALTDEPVAPSAIAVTAHELADAVAVHLDRICEEFFDDELRAVCQHVLASIVERPTLTTGLSPAEIAGAILWNVGRANNSFSGGLTQRTIQRELWSHKQLAVCGRRLQSHLSGVCVSTTQRPTQCPPVEPYANPDLLTPTTRRAVIEWRDAALAAAAIDQGVLPSKVDS